MPRDTSCRSRERGRLVPESCSWAKRIVSESPEIQSVSAGGVVESRLAVENEFPKARDSVRISPGESMASESA